MRTITIDILNEKALKLLKELERLKLIRVRGNKNNDKSADALDWSKYKGAMSKQPLSDVDKQLNDLRSEWE